MTITAILFMGGLGFTLAVLLAAASRIFHVEEDPRLAAIKSVLPGINCGACGYAGCEGAAKAILVGSAPVVACTAGGMAVIERLMRLTGKGQGIVELPTATVHCFGPARMEPRFSYNGPADCRAVAMLYGGWYSCEKGCLGGGTCVAVCPFQAVRLGVDRQPRIDPDRCCRCGRCADACPRGVIRMETLTDRLLHLDRTADCLAPCRQKCPAQINVPLFVGHLIRGEKGRALLEIKMRNPFPLTVGRTCPHPCENICRRNIADQGVAIGHLQRYLGEWERRSGKRLPVACLPDTGRRVAVVGGGPAGLSCAYFLRRLGHRATLFEARPELGGMLRYGIPAYRLPREIVDWEISGILELGMTVRTQAALGRDFTLTGLRHEGFEAIFLGLGAWTIPPLCVPGETAEGVWHSLDFLAAVGADIRDLNHKQVVVIGESNTAMDCARSSIRLGADAVSVICPRDRQEVSARKRDVTRAEVEGVVIRFMTLPVRIVTGGDNRVRQLAFQRLEPDWDASKKTGLPVALAGSETRIDADLVIIAYERQPDLGCLLEGEDAAMGFKTTPAATLAVESVTQLAAAPNVFAAGDMHTGRASVVSAVAGGRMAARSIHHLITTGNIPLPDDLHRRVNPGSILKGISLAPGPARVALKEVPVALRCRSFTEEVVATITDPQARTEAQRCLRCGTYCYAQQ